MYVHTHEVSKNSIIILHLGLSFNWFIHCMWNLTYYPIHQPLSFIEISRSFLSCNPSELCSHFLFKITMLGKALVIMSTFRLDWDFCRPMWGRAKAQNWFQLEFPKNQNLELVIYAYFKCKKNDFPSFALLSCVFPCFPLSCPYLAPLSNPTFSLLFTFFPLHPYLLLFNRDEWIKRRVSHVCVCVGRGGGGGKIKEGGRKGVFVNHIRAKRPNSLIANAFLKITKHVPYKLYS